MEEEDLYGKNMVQWKFNWNLDHKTDQPTKVPPRDSIEFLVGLVNNALEKYGLLLDQAITFKCFMEHKHKGIIFHAHPDYRREGPWHDWAYF
jgi:hypothetical protein